jgi:hypothetical protein
VLKDLNCPSCMDVRRVEMLEFSRLFGAEIKKVNAKGNISVTRHLLVSH